MEGCTSKARRHPVLLLAEQRGIGAVTYGLPDGLTVEQWIRNLLKTERTPRKFYLSTLWKRKRAQILAQARYECADCKRKQPAVYSRATCVHHVKHITWAPELALSDTYTDKSGKVHAQLVPLCDRCHNARHGRIGPKPEKTDDGLEPERW